MTSPVIVESIGRQQAQLESLLHRRLGTRIRHLRVEIRPPA